MIEVSQVDSIVQDFGYRLQMQGMGLEQYLKMMNTEMGAFPQCSRLRLSARSHPSGTPEG